MTPYPSPTALRRFDGKAVPLPVVRAVWAAVTRRPQASIRELAIETGIAYSRAGDALRILRDAGYIAHCPGTARARVVVVGLYPRP
jgi:DNA-binding MarR family transcriptional regulator